MKLSILIAGHVCIDKNTVNGAEREGWGSSAMYISNYLKNIDDIETFICAPYGKDFLPYSNSVNFINSMHDSKTMIYENNVIDGRRIQYCRNHKNIELPKINNKIKTRINQADILIIAPMIHDYPVEYVDLLISNASKKCLKVLLPQGYMRYVGAGQKVYKRNFIEARELLSKFDLVILSNEDSDDSLDLALRWTKKHSKLMTVVTQAELGASLFQNGTSISVPTTSILFNEIKNPVGSGDVFSANLSIALKHNPSEQFFSVAQANEKTGDYLKQTK